jgi:acetyl esterase/lipase
MKSALPIFGALVVLALLPASADPALSPAPDLVVPIPAPPSPANVPPETWSGILFKNVSQPELNVYLPPDKTKPHPAIIICPGGAYVMLAYKECVNDWLPFWRSQGFVVLGLKYRLSGADIPERRRNAVHDIGEALLLAHQNAAEWNIDPHQIGLWGGSAGSNAILNYLCQASAPPAPTGSAAPILPRFAVTLSPWPGRQKIDDFTFTSTTPPIFFASARDDKTAAESFAQALVTKATAQNRNDFFYVVDKGGHRAFTSFKLFYPEDDWKPSFLSWLSKILN